MTSESDDTAQKGARLSEFATVEQLRAHHQQVNMEEGRKLQQRQLDCQRWSYYSLFSGLAGGLVAAHTTLHQLSKHFPLLAHSQSGRGLIAGGKYQIDIL